MIGVCCNQQLPRDWMSTQDVTCWHRTSREARKPERKHNKIRWHVLDSTHWTQVEQQNRQPSYRRFFVVSCCSRDTFLSSVLFFYSYIPVDGDAMRERSHRATGSCRDAHGRCCVVDDASDLSPTPGVEGVEMYC
jgi:hypothetical protein